MFYLEIREIILPGKKLFPDVSLAFCVSGLSGAAVAAAPDAPPSPVPPDDDTGPFAVGLSQVVR